MVQGDILNLCMGSQGWKTLLYVGHMHPVSIKRCLVFVVTRAVAVVIFVPPEAPTTILTLWCLSNIIVGHIDESGLLPCQKTKVICLYSLPLNRTYISRDNLSFI